MVVDNPALWELVRTEQTYCEDLEDVCSGYLERLQRKRKDIENDNHSSIFNRTSVEIGSTLANQNRGRNASETDIRSISTVCHCSSLNCIINRRRLPLVVEPYGTYPTLPDEDIQTLFANVTELRDFHHELYAQWRTSFFSVTIICE
ncbi:uncharacterized protein LOC142358484 [Convolutriloba macropyga]|uniref:uncharacterized protein LOC142358484 n=1 Tax=Convolutriloba macropyga TaxID=536237 RepID=UPI003F51D896